MSQQSRRAVIALSVCIGLMAVISVSWFVKLRMRPTHLRVVKVDRPLPELALQRMNGTPIASSELRGRVTVLDFWGTWCPPCVEEMPVLNELATRYSSNPTVQILLVNPEMYGDAPGKIRTFLRKRDIAIPAALDPSHTCFEIGPMQFPTTLVIDRRGHIRYERTGYSGADSMRRELREEVDELLSQ